MHIETRVGILEKEGNVGACMTRAGDQGCHDTAFGSNGGVQRRIDGRGSLLGLSPKDPGHP